MVQTGTYSELMVNDGEFSKFVTEFGVKNDSKMEDGEAANGVVVIDDVKTKARQNAVSSGGIMQVR
jgi:hypothetical protein